MIAAATIEEEILADLPGGALRLTRLQDLAAYIDREALLRDQAVKEPPYWAHLWPAAVALARFVAVAELRGRRVIEVGCGLGVPSLAAARSGANVLLTDRNADALRFAQRNLARNGLRAAVVQMDWHVPALRGRFDLCLAADVTYDPSANESLVEFLESSLAADGEVWVAESVRAEEPSFPALLRRCFEVSEHRVAEIEDGHRVWVRILQGRRR